MKEKKYSTKEKKSKEILKEEVMEYSNFENVYSNLNLEELQNLQERIDDQIEIIKGEESLKNHKGFSESEMDLFIKECLEE